MKSRSELISFIISQLDSQIVKLINQRLLLLLDLIKFEEHSFDIDHIEIVNSYITNNSGPISNSALIEISSILIREMKYMKLISGKDDI